MLLLRLLLALPLISLILIGSGLSVCLSLIQGVLLIAAGIFLLIGLILRAIPKVGAASELFFAARRFLEKLMGIGFCLLISALLIVLIPYEFLFKGEWSTAELFFEQVGKGLFDPKWLFSILFPPSEDEELEPDAK